MAFERRARRARKVSGVSMPDCGTNAVEKKGGPDLRSARLPPIANPDGRLRVEAYDAGRTSRPTDTPCRDGLRSPKCRRTVECHPATTRWPRIALSKEQQLAGSFGENGSPSPARVHGHYLRASVVHRFGPPTGKRQVSFQNRAAARCRRSRARDLIAPRFLLVSMSERRRSTRAGCPCCRAAIPPGPRRYSSSAIRRASCPSASYASLRSSPKRLKSHHRRGQSRRHPTTTTSPLVHQSPRGHARFPSEYRESRSGSDSASSSGAPKRRAIRHAIGPDAAIRTTSLGGSCLQS